MTDAIYIEDLSYSYDDHPALNEVGLSVRKGEIYGLLGPNGGGHQTHGCQMMKDTILVIFEGDSPVIDDLNDGRSVCVNMLNKLAGFEPIEGLRYAPSTICERVRDGGFSSDERLVEAIDPGVQGIEPNAASRLREQC